MPVTDIKKFFILAFYLFIILKFYDWMHSRLGIGIGLYLVIFIILFWVFNGLMSKITLGKPIPTLIMFKIFPKMNFSNNWFGTLVAASLVFGFFLAKALGSAFVVYLIVIAGVIGAVKLFMSKADTVQKAQRKKELGLYIVAFVLGIAFGNNFTGTPFVVGMFIFGNILLYFVSEAGER